MDPIVILPVGLQYIDGEGDLVTQLPLSEYNILIGDHIVDLIEEVDHLDTITDELTGRVQVLEDEMPVLEDIPDFSAPGVMPDNNVYPIEEIVSELATQFVQLRTTTGNETGLVQAINLQDVSLKNEAALAGTGNMSAQTGWILNPTTVADTLKNMWITIQDMRRAVKNLVTPPPDCTDITVDFTVGVNALSETLTLFFYGSTIIPNGYHDCELNGAILKITDAAGHIYNTRVDVTQASGDPGGHDISLATTPVNANLDLSFELIYCFTNGTNICSGTFEKEYETVVNPCVTLTPNATTTTISIIFNPIVKEDVVYTLVVLDASDEGEVTTKTYTNPSTVVSDTITGLTAGTEYTLEFSVQMTGETSVLCSTTQVTTLT